MTATRHLSTVPVQPIRPDPSYSDLPGLDPDPRLRATARENPMGEELEELYRTTYATVVRFLYRKVWDADRAHDLAQP